MEFEVSFGTRFLGTVDHKNLFGLSTWKLSGRLQRTNSLMSILTKLILEGRIYSSLSTLNELILEAFGEALGGFGELWETLGESLGSLWEAFGRLWGSFGSLSEPFFSSRLLFLPYI